MNDPMSENDLEGLRLLAKARRLMVFTILGTFIAVATVLTIIGYRVFKSEGSTALQEVTTLLPKGARIIATGVSDNRILVTVEVAGEIEIRSFEVKTLKPAGKLKFVLEP